MCRSAKARNISVTLNTDISARYPHIPGYLDTASYGLPAFATSTALSRAAQDWSVAASLPDGARVLAVERDFSSVVYPFLADPRLNVTLVPLERLIDEIRPGVDLVAVSAAQSCDGRVVDLTALAMAAHSAGVKILVDVSQSAGWLPIHARDFDVVVAAAAVAHETLARQDIHASYTYYTALANDPRSELRMPASNSAILSVTGIEASALADAGVRASARNGCARLSFYIYNDAADVALAARTLHASALQLA